MAKQKRFKYPFRIYIYITLILIVICASVTLILVESNKKVETQNANNKPNKTIEQYQVTPNLTPTQTSTQMPIQTEAQDVQPYKDTTPPKVYILSPEDNQHIRTPFKIVANATDNIKVDHVDFYAGSSRHQYIGTVREAPFEIMWTPQGFGSNYTTNIPLEAIAYDAAGNSGYDFADIYLQN